MCAREGRERERGMRERGGEREREGVREREAVIEGVDGEKVERHAGKQREVHAMHAYMSRERERAG